MRLKPLGHSDSFLQLIILFLIAFFCVGIFILAGQGLVNFLWGYNVFENPFALQDYSNPAMIDINRLLLFFQHLGLFIVPAFVFSLFVSYNWQQYLGFLPTTAYHCVLGVLGMIVALPLINYLAYMNQNIQLPQALAGLESMLKGWESSAAKLTEAIAGSMDFSGLLINLLIIAIIPAIGEELIFRGLIMRLLARWTSRIHLAIWISAILFSALHMQFYGFLPRMLMGAFLGYVFIWSGSIWVCILAHLANNALALIFLYTMNSGALPTGTDEVGSGPGDFMAVVFSIVLLSIILWAMHRRSKFPERLSFFLIQDSSDNPQVNNE